jgi:hypothetical protein
LVALVELVEDFPIQVDMADQVILVVAERVHIIVPTVIQEQDTVAVVVEPAEMQLVALVLRDVLEFGSISK